MLTSAEDPAAHGRCGRPLGARQKRLRLYRVQLATGSLAALVSHDFPTTMCPTDCLNCACCHRPVPPQFTAKQLDTVAALVAYSHRSPESRSKLHEIVLCIETLGEWALLFCRVLRAGSVVRQQFRGLLLPPSERMIMMRRDLLWHNRDGGSALQLIGLALPAVQQACKVPPGQHPGAMAPHTMEYFDSRLTTCLQACQQRYQPAAPAKKGAEAAARSRGALGARAGSTGLWASGTCSVKGRTSSKPPRPKSPPRWRRPAVGRRPGCHAWGCMAACCCWSSSQQWSQTQLMAAGAFGPGLATLAVTCAGSEARRVSPHGQLRCVAAFTGLQAQPCYSGSCTSCRRRQGRSAEQVGSLLVGSRGATQSKCGCRNRSVSISSLCVCRFAYYSSLREALSNYHYCGSTLIAPRFLLTAAQ